MKKERSDSLMYNWDDKVIDKVYIEMDYKKAKPYSVTVNYRLFDFGDIFSLHLNDLDEIDRCVKAFTIQTKKSKYQLEKENRLFYLDKNDKKSFNSHVIENDLVNNRIVKSYKGQYKRPSNIVRNFKIIASIATISMLLVEGCHLLKKINNKDNILTYHNPDKKIEIMSDKMVISGYDKAQEIFYRLLEQSGDVSTNDIMFLTDFLTYASMTNSDYKNNFTYTRFNTVTTLYNAKEASRNKYENSAIWSILSNEDDLYHSCYIANKMYDRYFFNEDNAYKYFIYVTSLIRGGEEDNFVFSKYYNENLFVATRTESGYFKNNMTPLEKISIYTRLKGILNGDFSFKYKRDVSLKSYDLTIYNKNDYNQWLDQKIAYEQQKLIQENTKNTGKSK